jgi:ribonuclease BN (tRNA processing enzyme)
MKFTFLRRITPKQQKDIKIHLYGPKGFRKYMVTLSRDLLGWDKKPPWLKSVKELGNSTVRIGKTSIKSMPVDHTKKNCLAYRITSRKRSLVYSGDSVPCKSLDKICKGANVLVLDCSTADDAKIIPHMSASDCGRLAAKSGAKTAILSHLYPEADKENVVAICRKEFKGKIIKAKDKFSIRI